MSFVKISSISSTVPHVFHHFSFSALDFSMDDWYAKVLLLMLLLKGTQWNTSIYWIMISDTTFSLILWMIGWKTPRLPSLSSHYLLWLKDYFSKNVWMKDSLKWNKQKERFTINFSLCCISNSKSHSDGKINANENAFYQQKKICRTFLINICWNKSRISFISCWKRFPSSLICSEWFVKCLWILSSSPIDIT